MQRNEFKNALILSHYDRVREVTNNLMFGFATTAPDNDKKRGVNEFLRTNMGWPRHVTTLYDYRVMFPGVYERLFQFCIISLCSDAEIFFKALFDKYEYPKGSGLGFFQRIDDVFAALKNEGIDFLPIQSSIENLQLAFQIRHIGIHNMGVVDDNFIKKTGKGTAGASFLIDQKSYREMFEAYEKLLGYLDGLLPPLPAEVKANI